MRKLRIQVLVLLALALAGGSVGCGDDDSGTSPGKNDGGGGSGSGGKKGGHAGTGGGNSSGSADGGSGTDGGASGSNVGGGDGSTGTGGKTGGAGSGAGHSCPALKDRTEMTVAAEIDTDTTWTCDNLYILTDLIFVTKKATLTIEAGTEIEGDSGSALISTRGSQLIAKGTADAPIVFTSSAPEGSRAQSDWGGVVLLGAAPINIGDENRIEGIEATDDRGLYGGKDKKSNCGSLLYTRIEFAGYELSVDNELNGLTLGGCGSDTRISYVQVHRSSDDAIEAFGGQARLDHILMTACADDGYDSDLGNAGMVQFLAIQQDPTEADSAFEWNNQTNGNDDATPRSSPTVYNVTMIGGGNTTGPQNGMVLRGGTGGTIRNAIVMGFPISGIDVRDISTANLARMDPPLLTVENSLFFKNGSDGKSHFPSGSADDGADDNFVEGDFFTDPARMNVVDKDPQIGDAFSLTKPDYVPAKGSPAADGAATPPDDGFFDKSATYKGAFEPGGKDWTAGWTTHSKN